MKLSLITIFFIFLATHAIGQLSVKNLELNYGKHAVGYQHQLRFDSSRSYNFIQKSTEKIAYRPMSMSIWYPALDPESAPADHLKTLNYMEIYKAEQEWEQLPNEQLLNWFVYPNTPKNRRVLQEQSRALKKPDRQQGEFPVIIYSPGYEGSSVENFALCEFLASHGYVVVALPSRGSENFFLSGGSQEDLVNQVADIEFLLKMVNGWKNTDKNKIALMGFSFGGMSDQLAQMKNEFIKAVVSIDGSERYQYEKLKNSPFFSIEKADVPFIHLAQKDIPDEILKSDNIDASLNTDFKFYDDLKYADAYALKLHDLTHFNFTTLGVLLKNRDPRQDKSDEKIMASYQIASEYILQFLNGYLKSNEKSLNFLKNTPATNGFDPKLISKKHKTAIQKPVTFVDFNELASKSGYEQIAGVYEDFKSKNPQFQIRERSLNTLALQWLYNSDKPDYGIKVLHFAVSLFPGSSNLFDSLGEGYLVIGDQENALKNFRKAVRLDSGNFNSSERIKQLSKAKK
ncbi:MAG: prolyl oligopeptidase family serine peptidase [Bacteroidota bacterium]